MTSISKNMSLALGPDEILVNTVSPGSFASESFRAAVAALPKERGFDPDSLYDCMRWIAEDFGTGANINVDGGSDFT